MSQLPLELIQEIASLISPSDRKCLRATCRQTNTALEQIVMGQFSRHENVFFAQNCAKIGDSDPSPVFSLNNRHHFEVIKFGVVPEEPFRNGRQKRRGAWPIQEESGPVSENDMVNALSALPRLRELVLWIPPSLNRTIRFSRLSNLRSITLHVFPEREGAFERVVDELAIAVAKSPDLDSVATLNRIPHGSLVYDLPSAMQHLFDKSDPYRPLPIRHIKLQDMDIPPTPDLTVHFRYLVSLDLEVIPWYTTTRVLPFLRALESSGAFPVQLRVPWTWVADGTIAPYLRAHPGLQRFRSRAAYRSEEIKGVADIFYGIIFRQHAHSLTHLLVEPAGAGRWAFGEEIALGLARCTALVEVTISIDTPFAGPRGLSRIQRQAQRAIVWRLLDVGCRLPCLRTLTIVLAELIAPRHLSPQKGKAWSTLRRRAWAETTHTALTGYRGVPASSEGLEVHMCGTGDVYSRRTAGRGREDAFVRQRAVATKSPRGKN
ncbi:hypothetical protein C8F04DRAFT_1323061 [Mycena alexandri]|uniref:F-box domain-containing protein n=1 Tax=Mycena alexandri TaxID=1745969 RepID=A0AAD6TGM5_9AGAR|nr:hypothetical protein C8F04DRAFT_1323061 [Mycena alexandri]